MRWVTTPSGYRYQQPMCEYDPQGFREMEARVARQHERRQQQLAETAPTWQSRIREAMRLHGMTERELAAEIGFQPQSVGKWFRGITQPSPAILGRLCEVLDLPKGEMAALLGHHTSFIDRKGVQA